MTKNDYLDSLKEKLEKFGKELQEEILEDYRQHFAEGEKQGRTEEEIIEELGNVEEMIRELSEMDQDREPDREYKKIERERNCTYIGEYKGIELSGEEADILLEPSEENRIQVEYKNDKGAETQLQYDFYQYDKDGIFFAGVRRIHSGENQRIKILGKIMVTYQSHFFGNNGGSIQLRVRVPKGMLRVSAAATSGDISACDLEVGELQCKTGSGDIDISAIRLKKLQIGSGSGDIDASGIRAESGSIHAASGDIDLNDCEIGELACSTASGDISMKARTKDCRCSTGSGDIDLKVTGPERINCSAGSGDLKLQIQDVDGVEAKISQGSGDAAIYRKGEGGRRIKGGTYTYGNGACKVKVSIGSGDMELYI
ncbi:MAG: DUF4097 family beta strand repeat-containing protein [Acetatifactor sp.]|nr:DUF4097 family beta strand repeat-containing protein [Acetatifactor sp.]